MGVHTAYIGAGSNIGDKFLNCKNGISALTHTQNAVEKDSQSKINAQHATGREETEKQKK